MKWSDVMIAGLFLFKIYLFKIWEPQWWRRLQPPTLRERLRRQRICLLIHSKDHSMMWHMHRNNPVHWLCWCTFLRYCKRPVRIHRIWGVDQYQRNHWDLCWWQWSDISHPSNRTGRHTIGMIVKWYPFDQWSTFHRLSRNPKYKRVISWGQHWASNQHQSILSGKHISMVDPEYDIHRSFAGY